MENLLFYHCSENRIIADFNRVAIFGTVYYQTQRTE